MIFQKGENGLAVAKGSISISLCALKLNKNEDANQFEFETSKISVAKMSEK